MRTLPLALLVACNGTGDDTDATDTDAATCALGTEARALVEEGVLDVLGAAMWVTSESHGDEMAMAMWLVGVDQGELSVGFLAEPCTEPATFEPYCASEGAEPGAPFVCSRLMCEDAAVPLVDAWWTDADHADSQDPHPLVLEGALGTVTYDPNPVAQWRNDEQGAEGIVTGFAAHAVTVELADGTVLDLSHTAIVSGTHLDATPTGMDVEVAFDGLGVVATLAAGEDGHPTGTVTIDDEVVAELVETTDWYALDWSCD